MSSRCRTTVIAFAGRVLAALMVSFLATSPAARASDTSELVAAIDGRPVADATERRPIRLHPKREASLELRVTNTGSAPFEVRTVRLQGQVMALTFFAYDTSVEVPVAPGATESRTFLIDLIGLGAQATGLIQGSVSLLDADRRTLASQQLVVDVRGSLWSVYGAFGLTLAVITTLSLGGALFALARHQLPENRWRRGLRFLTPGLGVGLIVVFTLSALRFYLPRPGLWIPILLITGGVFFALGYLTPTPEEEDEDDQDHDGDDGWDDMDGDDATQSTATSRRSRPTGDGRT